MTNERLKEIAEGIAASGCVGGDDYDDNDMELFAQEIIRLVDALVLAEDVRDLARAECNRLLEENRALRAARNCPVAARETAGAYRCSREAGHEGPCCAWPVG